MRGETCALPATSQGCPELGLGGARSLRISVYFSKRERKAKGCRHLAGRCRHHCLAAARTHSLRHHRPRLLESFQSPEDFTVRKQTLEYSNGDVYKVRHWLAESGAALLLCCRCRSVAAPSTSIVPEQLAVGEGKCGVQLYGTMHGLHVGFQCMREVLTPGVSTACACCFEQGAYCYDPCQGEALGKLRHGRGTHTSSNGDVYEGQWRFNKRHGRGKVTLHSGVQYDGEWQDDLAHGWGAALGRARATGTRQYRRAA